jgi:hypothetical protein
MNEKEYYNLVMIFGYFLIAARGMLFITLLRKFFVTASYSAYRMLFWYSFFALIIAIFEVSFIHLVNTYKEFFMPILTKFEIGNTFFISPLYWLNELIFVGLFFSKLLSFKREKIVRIVAFTLFIIEILNTIFVESYKDSQPIGSILAPLFEVILAILLIQENFNKKINSKLRKDTAQIIAWSFLMMNTFSILIYFFSDKLFKNYRVLYYQISLSRMLVESFCILLIAYAVYLNKPFSSKKI